MLSTLPERLRNIECDREPFSADHAHCVCRAAVAAAEEIERLEAALASLKARAGTLAVHVRGHFAMASETSPAICQKWADAVHEAVSMKCTS